MALDGCGRFLKCTIFTVNFLIFVLGVTALGLGIWAKVNGSSMDKVLGVHTLSNSAIILLIIGGIVAFISFLGCCGAIRESKCLLLMFFIVLFVITCGIIAGVVFGYKIRNEIASEFKSGLNETIKEANEGNDELKKAWDELQKNLRCCGAKSFKDWGTSAPDGCKCETVDENCVAHDKVNYWKRGCAEEIEKEIEKYATPLVAIGLTIMLIIILAMVFSCSLYCQI